MQGGASVLLEECFGTSNADICCSIRHRASALLKLYVRALLSHISIDTTPQHPQAFVVAHDQLAHHRAEGARLVVKLHWLVSRHTKPPSHPLLHVRGCHLQHKLYFCAMHQVGSATSSTRLASKPT